MNWYQACCRVEAAALRSVTGIRITTETMFPAFREAFLKNKKIKNKLVRAENSVRAGMINKQLFLRGPYWCLMIFMLGAIMLLIMQKVTRLDPVLWHWFRGVG
jgi:hypothetical protein